MRALLLIPLLLFLGSCSEFTEYRALKAVVKSGVATAIEDRKSFNDTKGEVVMALPCDMSLGAAMRIGNERKKAILIELCGGPPANSQITVEDLLKLQGSEP